MTVRFRKSFLRDLRKLSDARVRKRVGAVLEAVEAAESLTDAPGLKKVSGAGGYYRVRIGDHRIGIAVEGGAVEFVRVLHRRDVYRHFP